jgi:hypothetical protein
MMNYEPVKAQRTSKSLHAAIFISIVIRTSTPVPDEWNNNSAESTALHAVEFLPQLNRVQRG